MVVVLNEAGLAAFFGLPTSPLAPVMLGISEVVAERARANASGAFIDIVTGDLKGGIKASVEVEDARLVGVVSTDARHGGIDYPAIVARAGDEPGRWLAQTVEDPIN